MWILPAQQPFRFDPWEAPLWRLPPGMVVPIINPSPHLPPRGQECNRHWTDQRPLSPQFPSPSLDCRFKGVTGVHYPQLPWCLSRSDRSDRSWHLRWGRQHQEDGAHMKINLPVFKDEDAKDAVTYQSWRWDLMVYWCAGCRDCTLLPYAIRSLQGYPGELVWSSSMDITLDEVLTILDEHYNNVKALDMLNQELFQLWQIRKHLGLGHLPFEASPGFGSFLPWSPPPLIVWQSWRETTSMADFPSN